jgi:CRISPR-associated protein Csx14
MPRQTVLISSLGESPAVVTEAIDKLEQEERLQFTQVITLGTSQSDVRQGVEILSEHIPTHYNGRIVYLHHAIEATDVLTEKDNLDYLTLVAQTLRTYRPFSDIYVSLAGGRKTMSALMALAVQIYGAKLLCHVVHLLMDEHLQRKMEASYMKRYPEEQPALLHPDLEELEVVRLPVVSLFPLLNDFLSALGGQDVGALDKTARVLLEDTKLIEREGSGWKVTGVGKQLHAVLSDIELLPEPSSTLPHEKTVDLKDHHGKDALRPHAERLRFFPYAERVDSTDFNSQFDRSRTFHSPYGRLLVEVKAGQPDVLIVTLADSQKGYRLAVRTKAQTTAQAERVRRELERFLGKQT